MYSEETAVATAAVLYIDPSQAELLGQNLSGKGVSIEMVPFVGKTLAEMASNLVECFTDRTIDLYPCSDLLDYLRRLQLRESPASWRLFPARAASGHGDRATSLALAVLAAKREGGVYSGPWSAPPAPVGNDRGPLQQLLEDHPDAFAPSSLAPADPHFRSWFGQTEDRPL